MKIAVLGGLGIQGRAAVADLTRSPGVEEVVCADVDLRSLPELAAYADLGRVRGVVLDASSSAALVGLLEQVDVAVDLLPLPFMRNACEAAIEARVGLVTTNYGKPLADLHGAAVAAGVSLMPECGLDPGIDLVLYGRALEQFDRLEVMNSYCGGVPEASACDNPLRYKVSWNWEMVLRSQMRDAVFVHDGQRYEIPGALQHDNPMIHTIQVPGVGELEAVPNGDAAVYTEILGVADTVREAGRYLLRWPGWSAFWAPLKRFGLLSEEPVPGIGVSPREFLARFLGPQLQYRRDERDLVVMHNVFRGSQGGRYKTVTQNLVIARDLESGLLAMSMGVGYPASIAAQMIARGEVRKPGLLSPTVDLPTELFLAELAARGLRVQEEVRWDD